MYFAPYFLIAFAVNFGLLSALGWASDEVLWAEDARLIGCAGYSALVALVFALVGLQRPPQVSSVLEPATASEAKPLVVEASSQAAEFQRETSEQLTAMQHPYPWPGQASSSSVQGELVT